MRKKLFGLAVFIAIGSVFFWGQMGKKLLLPFFIDLKIVGIERNLPKLQQVGVTLLGYSSENARATIYRTQDNNIPKIVVEYFGELGKKEVTYYLDNNAFINISEEASDYDKPFGEVVKTNTNKAYFEEDKLIAWFSQPQQGGADIDLKQAEMDEEWEKLLLGIGPRLKWEQKRAVPLASFIPGKVFINSCEAGEQGIFKKDGTLPVSILGEKVTKLASWKVDGEKLVISGSSISDAIYEDFVFEEHADYEAMYGGYTVAHKKCFAVGSKAEIIDEFNRASWYDLLVQ